MQDMTWPDRIEAYEAATGFPKSLFVAGDGRVVGTFIMVVILLVI